MRQLLLLLASTLYLSCSSEDQIPTHEISGFAYYTDERGDLFDIPDHSGIKVSLLLDGETLKDTITSTDGSYQFIVLDSIAYDFSFNKEEYVEMNRENRFPRLEPYHDHIPSLPIYYVNSLSIQPSEYETRLIISMEVKNYLITRYDPTYFRFFLSSNPEVSHLNYQYTQPMMLHHRPEFITPMNTTDAQLTVDLNFFDLNEYESGQILYLAIYSTTYVDPFIESQEGQLLYTGLSEQFARNNFIKP